MHANYRHLTLDQTTLAKLDDSLESLLAKLKVAKAETLIVTNSKRIVLGTVTYGDILNFTLNKGRIPDKAGEVVNREPQTLTVLNGLIPDVPKVPQSVRLIPLVTQEGLLTSALIRSDIQTLQHDDWKVLVVAGGRGERLRPLTDKIPKPLIPVGGIPISERLVSQLSNLGFSNFTFSVGYLGEQIADHFGDGRRWGCDIDYIFETEPRGTAGALAYLASETNYVLMLNADILTQVDFGGLVVSHVESRASLTVVTREIEVRSEFGVVDVDSEGNVLSIREKPSSKNLINAGIYAISLADVRGELSTDPLQANELINRLMASNYSVRSFPASEFWLDLGRPSDLEKANKALSALGSPKGRD